LAAAVIRSSEAGVTVRCCSCLFLVSSHNQEADDSFVQLLISAEPSRGTRVASVSAVKLCVGASARLQAWHESEHDYSQRASGQGRYS